MDEPQLTSNTDAVEALGCSMTAPTTNCYVADAQREAMSPQQFTATYDQARDFIREAGELLSMWLFQRQRSADSLPGVTVEDITKLSDRFWAFYLGGMCYCASSRSRIAIF